MVAFNFSDHADRITSRVTFYRTGRNIEHLLGHKRFKFLRHLFVVEVDKIFSLDCRHVYLLPREKIGGAWCAFTLVSGC
jgi:hypothetical protein